MLLSSIQSRIQIVMRLMLLHIFLRPQKSIIKMSVVIIVYHKGSDCISNKIILMNESGYPDYLSDRVALINEALKEK